MLALRLARGARPAVQLRRLLVAVASGGTGFLLLCTLGYALGHPQAPANALFRLLWCLAPLVATVDFAVAVARSDPGTRPRASLFAVGLGPVRLMALSALSLALTCAAGSVLALLLFLQLRGNLTGLPFDGAADVLLAADRPLPAAAVLTLLALVPLAASVAGALALRPRPGPARGRGGSSGDSGRGGGEDPDAEDRPPAPASRPAGLTTGVALLAAGLAVEAYAGGTDGRTGGTPLPNGLAHGSLGVLLGWGLTALGLALAGPALTHLAGRLLQAARPSALRLLAGRILQQEARRLGRPLGVVCAVASGGYAAATLYAREQPGTGPMSLLGAGLVAGCTLATLLMAAVEVRRSRADTTAALLRLGAPAGLLRTAVALRAAALLAVFLPLTWGVSALAALPLGG
ncbi:hypothetical protein GCM10018793_58900 [Streptomyces sulfonofaciens]|uniref:Uncharacterized protein n=1 Tax=Streptomyces sulfonofaciens TaxID=68272 RepID=A0A919GM38_9ACTN|nr:hypothetical protein [Streptomyces sulfonofaciens]GHH86568.1 hypothetical protein GCM10018793_58900 [Streptomyces sulfonofaciens]